MDGKKVYQIEINGIKDSISAVDALNKALNNLEQRIKTLEKSSVNVSASGGKGNASTLSEEAAIQKEINKLKAEGAALDAKIVAAQDEVYKKVDATKQLYKETVADQKALAAQERLTADAYSNTMQGMKQNLADLKAVINTTDMGDTQKIQQMTQKAGELTQKLKGMEEAYGQFGRNVGNYANGVAEGMQKITITVGGAERTFNNAKEASRTLGNELKTMAINGQQGTKAFKDMQVAVAKLNSDIKDATVSSKAMDNLLDTMQSFTALGQVSQGFSALFGFDDDQIQKSIQKLVALQNVMQGIEKINQQMNSQEGIGGWLSKGNAAVDTLVAKLTGANKAQLALNASTTAGATASNTLAAAETAQATATAGATVATKALSFALKTLGIGLIITAVAYLVENWKDLYKWLANTIPALKNISTWFDKIKAVAMGVGSVIINWLVQPLATLIKVIQSILSGNFSDIPKIIGEGFKKQFDVIGNYQKGYNRQIEKQQEAHNKKMREQQKQANEEFLKDEEAKYGKSHKRTQEYLKKQMALTEKGSKEYKELQRQLWEDERQEREENQKKSLAAAKKYAKEEAEIEKEMAQLRINAMKEGLNKTIKQLEEERKQRLAKLRENGRQYKEEEAEINRIYDLKILEAKQEWAQNVQKVYEDMWEKIKADSLQNTREIVKIAQNAIDIQKQNLSDSANEFFNQGIGSYGIQGKGQLSPTTQFSLGIASGNKSEFMSEMKEYIDMTRELQTIQNKMNAIIHKTSDDFSKLSEAQKQALDEEFGRLNMSFDLVKNNVDNFTAYLKEKYGDENFNGARLVLIEENYSTTLAAHFDQRISAIEAYWAKRKKIEATNAENLYQDQLKEENESYQAEKDANFKNLTGLTKQLDEYYEKKNELIEKNLKDGTITIEQALEQWIELDREYTDSDLKMQKNYNDKNEELRVTHEQNVIKIEQDKNNKLKATNAEYYQSALQELRDFQTAVASLESKQPVMNSFGFTNFGKTNENYRNLLSAYESMANKIMEKRKQVNQDYQEGIIGKDAFDSTIRELDNFSENLGQKMDEVKAKLSLTQQFQTLMGEISQYASQLGSALSSLVGTIGDYTDQQYENEINQLQDYIDEYEDMLDKQKDIVEQHKDAIDSIEDELATARGDRRQHLIDQLNAQMEAERRELAEQKKIEKQKKALEDKKKTEEKKRNEQQKKIAKTQAIISGALAISNALAVQPFWVGLAMAAMAAAASAIQIATIDAQKFASGGVIQGKSHAQGGVKVLGGRAEVEGGEFITNKTTTAKNVDLLEYINAKHRRLSIDDFIDFYSSGVKKNINSMSPRAKFADGGVIPTLNNEYQFDDRLLSAFEDYANRPYVVSVVDINSRQEAVKNVQVLAGLGE